MRIMAKETLTLGNRLVGKTLLLNLLQQRLMTPGTQFFTPTMEQRLMAGKVGVMALITALSGDRSMNHFFFKKSPIVTIVTGLGSSHRKSQHHCGKQ
jgi:hypothetical protein